MRVWADCTAAAHPLVLRPILERLRERGHEVTVTTREYGQTIGVLERLGMSFEVVGRHGGASTAGKAVALARRSALLARWARRRRFDLGIAHGSVDIAVVGALLRVPTAQMQDYEHAKLQRRISFRLARRVLVPDAIPVELLARAGAAEHKLFRFPGLKEDYYLADFSPDAGVLSDLGLEALGVSPRREEDDLVLVVVRPPPETSEYHADNPAYERVLDRLAAEQHVAAVIVPRTDRQAYAARARNEARLVVPDHAVDAQSLIAFADLVVSAGGTMNREAVALGTPVYTIFSGRIGALDAQLIADGRLRQLADPAEIELRKRETPAGVQHPRDPDSLVEAMLSAARRPRSGKRV